MGREEREAYAERAKAEMLQQHEADRANEQAVLNQQAKNKAHDTELSQFSEGSGSSPDVKKVIGQEEIKKAYQTLLDYKAEKSSLERRIEENEQFWKMNHWDYMDQSNKRIKPKSGWLVNTIRNKHADAMDNYPEANILPRARDDEETAKILSDIIPVILDQNDFQHVYDRVQWYKIKNGAGVYSVQWNNDKNNGLGDIDVNKVDLANIYWKGGITDIQDSQNVFFVTMIDKEEVKDRFPNIDKVNNDYAAIGDANYNRDENIDKTGLTAIIDWYYKKRIEYFDDNGIPKVKTLLHYCQFTNGQVIYASENDPTKAETGWYEHGRYPFVFDVMYPMEGSIVGMGEVDIVKDDQMYIDKLQQAILENAVANARPRWAVRQDADLNEDEFLDISNPLVHFNGHLGEEAYKQIVASPLSGIYETVYLNKIQEMKDTSGNTAATQGQASSVTSASGIASLQEAAGKLSRDTNLSSYRAYKQVVDLIIELIREFYDEPRCFRIIGENGQNNFVDFDNSGLRPQSQGRVGDIDLGSRLPIMDIDVRPQKKNAYSRESQNQTAMNLYAQGFFAPNNADAALACLEMMDFDGIEKIRDRVGQNGTLFDQVMQLQQTLMQLTALVDQQNGTDLTQRVAAGQQQNMNIGAGRGGKVDVSKGSLSSQAASASRESTAPR